MTIRVHKKKKDGYLMINRIGEARFMTWFQGLMYSWFGKIPKF